MNSCVCRSGNLFLLGFVIFTPGDSVHGAQEAVEVHRGHWVGSPVVAFRVTRTCWTADKV